MGMQTRLVTQHRVGGEEGDQPAEGKERAPRGWVMRVRESLELFTHSKFLLGAWHCARCGNTIVSKAR